jgi:hypothetical protein
VVVKLNSLSRWSSLGNTKSISFKGDPEAERLVRIQFNLETVTTFYIGKDEHDADLLCTIGPGLETVEFYAQGDFYVFGEQDSGIVKYQSADLEPTSFEVVNPVIFTKIANRRQRNPELEAIAHTMQMNSERRLADLAYDMKQEFERQLGEMRNAQPAETIRADTQGENPQFGGGNEPKPVTSVEKPGNGASGDNGSQQQGGSDSGNSGQAQASQSA